MGSFCRKVSRIYGKFSKNKRKELVLLDYLDGSLWALGFACSAN